MAEQVESKQEQPKDTASTKQNLGTKVETYGLVILALVISAFYIFWLVLFCVGATRLPHN